MDKDEIRKKDEFYMRLAIVEAEKAFEANEIPVGAVIVYKNQLIAKSHNLTEMLNDVTAHAEILSITSASNRIGGKYLNECTIYVTVEPCVMCAGAIGWSQIQRVVVGCKDEKRGFSTYAPLALHPKASITFGILEEECKLLMQRFFKNKR